jgi:hypothetical protein
MPALTLSQTRRCRPEKLNYCNTGGTREKT